MLHRDRQFGLPIGPLFALGFMDIEPELPYLICSGIAITTALFGLSLSARPINQLLHKN